jgi:hypothetical protein
MYDPCRACTKQYSLTFLNHIFHSIFSVQFIHTFPFSSHRFSLFFHVVISVSIFFLLYCVWFITYSVNYVLIKFYKTNHFKYYKLYSSAVRKPYKHIRTCIIHCRTVLQIISCKSIFVTSIIPLTRHNQFI